MDFFERAHVVKKSAVKKTKSDETVKKQLKHMLYGYKQNDNKVIKEAENVKMNVDESVYSVDDSDSVSGFSDISLSNSTKEGDKSKETLSNIESINVDSSHSCSPVNEKETQDDNSKLSAESISQYDDDIQSLPEDTQLEDIPDTSSKNKVNCKFDKGTKDSSDPERFDPDGNLACKILKRIKDKEKIKQKKRKLNDKELDTSSDESTKYTNSFIRQSKNYITVNQDEDDEDLAKVSDDEADNHETEDSADNSDTGTQDSASTNISSPFISVTATDMPDQSLGEILGGYRHPTIKNMPCERQNVIYTTANSEIFAIDNVDSTDIVVEDEADSLIPELGDEPAVEDLEEALTVPLATPIDESIVIEDVSIPITKSDEPTEPKDSNIINPVKVYHGNNTCILVLKHPAKIYLHGKVLAKAFAGTLEVYGYTLKNTLSEIYAPNYNFAQCIKTVESENVYNGLFGKLTSAGVSVQDAEEVVTTVKDYDGVLSLSPLSKRRIDFVESNFSSVGLFSKPSKFIDNCFKRASELLGCSLYLTQPDRCFAESVKWEQVIACGLDNGSRAIICGGKNTGKSTFLRYYVNKLVNNGPILVIDLDPGQAELTVAGNVSATVVTKPFIGPNFTHLQRPEKMLNIGMINIMDNPSRYASAITELFEYCHSNKNYKNMPWVVNTMGMCNNMGLKFIILTILLARPTHLVQMDSVNQKKRFEIDLHPLSVQGFLDDNKYDRVFKKVPCPEKLKYTFIISSPVEANAKIEMSISAKDLRYLNYLAYFGELLDSHMGPGILAIVPYELNIQDLNIGTNINVQRDVVTRVINGKIIALCQVTMPDKGRVFNLRDNAVLCLGHGLIRGVDIDKGLLYIITPAPVHTLHINTLLYSDWVPELKGQDQQLPDGTVIPYRTTSKQRQLMTTPHRRFNPLQLLKMSRKS